LQGDVKGALTDLGQASHTAQDIVRHKFESASEHGLGEAPATPTEKQAAVEATNGVLDAFTNEVYRQALQDGLTSGQATSLLQNVLQGAVPGKPLKCRQHGGGGAHDPHTISNLDGCT
jgi:hypothetical protein